MDVLEQRDEQVIALYRLRRGRLGWIGAGQYQEFVDQEAALLAKIWELEQRLPVVAPWPYLED